MRGPVKQRLPIGEETSPGLRTMDPRRPSISFKYTYSASLP
jgi:hypothetical protein